MHRYRVILHHALYDVTRETVVSAPTICQAVWLVATELMMRKRVIDITEYEVVDVITLV